VIGAVAAGAREVLAIDLAQSKRAMALEAGVTQAFDGADPECVDKVRAATNGGLDHVFEFAGSTRAFETAYRITRRSGTTTTAGLPPPQAAFALPIVNMVGEERTLKGSYIGTCVPARDLPRYVSLCRAGRLPVNRIMTGRLRLQDINEGFDRLHAGEAVRQVVVFD
jgi:alcohol dehydrogenase